MISLFGAYHASGWIFFNVPICQRSGFVVVETEGSDLASWLPKMSRLPENIAGYRSRRWERNLLTFMTVKNESMETIAGLADGDSVLYSTNYLEYEHADLSAGDCLNAKCNCPRLGKKEKHIRLMKTDIHIWFNCWYAPGTRLRGSASWWRSARIASPAYADGHHDRATPAACGQTYCRDLPGIWA